MTAYVREREQILRDLAHSPPRAAVLVRKNWKRYAAVAAAVERHAPRVDGCTILDYGCGYPIVVKLLRLLGYAAVGYEPYADDEQRAVATGLGILDLYNSSLAATDVFSFTLLVDVVEHLAVPGPTLRDLGEHLAPGGTLLVSTPNVLRFETYWSFVLRRTGHPTALAKYLSSDNAYVHHQREFTMAELQKLLDYFGYDVIDATFNDVRPELGVSAAGGSLKRRVFALTRPLLSRSLVADNLLVLARRRIL